MKTVYFLGAGASAGSDFKLPVMSGFFDDPEFLSGQYPALSEYIRTTFKEQPSQYVNLEEVITQLELSFEGFGVLWEKSEPILIKARDEFDQYIRNRLQHCPPDEPRSCACHENIFRRMLESDANSIITLNYDLVTDYTLYNLCKDENGKMPADSIMRRSNMILGRTILWGGEAPSVYYEYRLKGFYLKLHGSIDWVYCPNRTCGHHQLFFQNSVYAPQSHTLPGEPCVLCGSRLVSVIIPPAMGKSFEKFPKMGLIWNLAYRELKMADRYVLIGMSFPESDYYLRWLFREVLRHRQEKTPHLIIVNPNEEDIRKTFQVFGLKSVETHRTIKEYAEHLSSTVSAEGA